MTIDGADDAELSKALLNRILDIFQSVKSEIKQENGRLGCSIGIQNAVGDQIYPILEAMSDTPEIVSKMHLDLLIKEVGQNTARNFDLWLNQQKTMITQVKYNYKEYYEAPDRDAHAKNGFNL